MSIAELKKQQIQRKDHVDEQYRTDGKKEAADWIQQHVIDAGRWPMDMEDIAEEAGWSRQQISNTIRDYFEPVGGGFRMQETDSGVEINIDVPAGMDPEVYARGYLRGYLDASEQ